MSMDYHVCGKMSPLSLCRSNVRLPYLKKKKKKKKRKRIADYPSISRTKNSSRPYNSVLVFHLRSRFSRRIRGTIQIPTRSREFKVARNVLPDPREAPVNYRSRSRHDRAHSRFFSCPMIHLVAAADAAASVASRIMHENAAFAATKPKRRTINISHARVKRTMKRVPSRIRARPGLTHERSGNCAEARCKNRLPARLFVS